MLRWLLVIAILISPQTLRAIQTSDLSPPPDALDELEYCRGRIRVLPPYTLQPLKIEKTTKEEMGKLIDEALEKLCAKPDYSKELYRNQQQARLDNQAREALKRAQQPKNLEAHIQLWITDLAAEDWNTRDAAFKKLFECQPEEVCAVMRTALENNKDVEQRSSLTKLLLLLDGEGMELNGVVLKIKSRSTPSRDDQTMDITVICLNRTDHPLVINTGGTRCVPWSLLEVKNAYGTWEPVPLLVHENSVKRWIEIPANGYAVEHVTFKIPCPKLESVIAQNPTADEKAPQTRCIRLFLMPTLFKNVQQLPQKYFDGTNEFTSSAEVFEGGLSSNELELKLE